MKMKPYLSLALCLLPLSVTFASDKKTNRSVASTQLCGQLRGYCLGANEPDSKPTNGCTYSINDGTTGTSVHPSSHAILASFKKYVEDWVCVIGEQQNDGFSVTSIKLNDTVQ
jgi:hypothetical protein